MKNFVQKGSTLTMTAPADVTSGQLVVVGSIVGVAGFDAATGTDVEITVEGVFELPKVTTDVIAQGDKLYWDSGQAKLTKTAGSGSKPIGGRGHGRRRQRRHHRELPPDADRADRSGVDLYHQNFS
jgi:predicted RecA/RadA family phage recombinase